MKFIKRLVFTIILVIVLVISYIIYSGHKMYVDAINNVSIETKVEQIKNSENFVTLSDVSDDFEHAIVAVEDHRFYSHHGIDFITTTRSMLQNISEKDIVAGGSTITQQLGRIMYFTQEQRFSRKIAELFVAFNLEDKYLKDEILELYINSIYYGNGYYGIKEAANGFYNKSPNELNLYEASLLAGLPNAPSVYSPTNNLDLAHKRQSSVLNAMVKYNYISNEQKEKVESER